MDVTSWPIQYIKLSWMVNVFPCWSELVNSGKGGHFLKCADSNKDTRIMKNWVHLTAPREINKVPGTDPKEMQIYAQFRMILLKKFSKLQEYTDRWLSEIRKTMQNKWEIQQQQKNRNHWEEKD